MAKRKEARPWMRLWVEKYASKTMHLDAAGHGAYFLLIMEYWRRGEALPDNDDALRNIARCDMKQWRRLRPIICEFFAIGDGVWHHHMVEEELAKARGLSAVRAGASGARWSKGGAAADEAGSNCNANGCANAYANAEETNANGMHMDMHLHETSRAKILDTRKNIQSHPSETSPPRVHVHEADLGRLVDGVWALSGQRPERKGIKAQRRAAGLAQQWLSKGWGVDAVLEAAGSVLAGRKVGDPWTYLDQSLPDRMADAAPVGAAGAGGGGAFDPEASKRVSRVRNLVEHGLWLKDWGTRPGPDEVAMVTGGGR